MAPDETPDPTGRVKRLAVEVPTGPEEVWQAIATGDGTAGWMFPTDIEAREGGTVVVHREPFGPTATATVTAWEPPHRLAYEEPIDGGPPLATEFLVETRAGGTCVVRVVSGFRHDGEGWEDLVEGAGEGWRMTLLVLRSYLAHFAGRPAAGLDTTVPSGDGEGQTDLAAVLMRSLGVDGLTAGDPFRSPPGAPPLAGVVDHVEPAFVLIRADEPCPALFALSVFPMGPEAGVSVNLSGRLYGTDAPAVAERDRPRWSAWFAEQIGAPTPP